MREKLKIRKANLKDAGIIADRNIMMAMETEQKELDVDTALKGTKALIKDPHKGFYLVAEMGGKIVGQLMVTLEWSDWRNRNFFWLQSVYVPAEYRKQGIFAALFHHLKEIAKERKNVAGLRLYVEQHNETAKTVYESLGMFDTAYNMYELNL